MDIAKFVDRCGEFQRRAGVSRTWLSKRLFQDTYRLDDLAAGKTDIGVKRLERAIDDLRCLEAERGAHRDGAAA